ncbi:MAG: amino acid adenylation domain-containing protein [Gammaproteobacteria bacterium]|nr:amino acid adenylation domain-containing protein [Gammaproteobacteria bacterium]
MTTPARDADLAARVAALSPAKKALLARRLREQGNRFRLFPSSFSQQRLWFLQQLDRDSAAYNIPLAVAVEGPLDAGVLQASLGLVCERHETLRTTFTEVHGEPMQRVLPRAPQRLRVVDVSAAAPSRREALVRAAAAAESRVPFALDRCPPVRATLFRLSDSHRVLLVVMHHIVSDGWSSGVLIRELAASYDALARGLRPALPELPIQYADFAAWQRRRLTGAELDRLLAYWSAQLADSRPLQLPTDRPRHAQSRRRGARRHLPLEPELAGAIAALCRRERVTPFHLLLGAFVALLSRWSGSTDVAVGTPVANRTRVETEPLIGVFINTLVIRIDLAGRPRVADLLRRVRQQTLDAVAHQELPFELLVQKLKPDRDAGSTPFFNVLFTWQKAPRYDVPAAGLRVEPFPLEPTTSKLDLSVSVTDTDGELKLSAEYDADLFDAATIERLLRHFRQLLRCFVDRPEAVVAELPLASEAEMATLAALRLRSPYPEQCAHRLFERQARARPDAIALCMGAEQLSYAELNRRANRLAHELRRRGVGAEEPVALCLPRSTGSVVATLAVLKAGGCYVPLDPGHPAERLRGILHDVGARLVLCQPARAAHFTGFDGDVWPLAEPGSAATFSDVRDRTSGRFGAAGVEDPPNAATPDSLAYVMFTSGSTGAPKGIAVPHRAIARLVCATNYMRFGRETCIGMVANPAFDAATFELWGALANGGRVAVIPADVALSPEELGATLREQAVSALFLTSALFNRVVQDAPAALAALDDLLTGGEAADPQCFRRFLELAPRTRLANVYGPTETTTFALWHAVEAIAPDAANVPIGTPIANTEAVVLDRNLQPVPFGATGELYIGGDGVARGYFGRPELTAGSFVPDPSASVPGGRLYRTGDLVAVRPDGALEFRGRIDDQVKIRGYRIEVAEIETVLARHAAVRDAVVVPRQDRSGEKRLVAYVTCAATAPEASDLRTFLRRKLPDYMLPSAFVTLPELPLNANGKVDRRALPPPAADGAGERGQPGEEECLTPTEELLSGMIGELLGRGRVGPEDDFFELGGHSLLATQLVSRIRAELGTELSVRAVFEQPSARGLGREVERWRRDGSGLAAAIRPVERGRPLPLSYDQTRLWFVDQLEPGSASYNIPTAVRLDGLLDVGAFAAALRAIATRHEAFRTVFAMQDEEPVQIVGAAPARLAVVDLRELPPAARERELRVLLAADALEPFDLAKGPLLRMRLIALAADAHVASFTAHHIVCDEWSLVIMLRELEHLYAALAAGRAPALPKPGVQPADFACWQREHLRGETLEALLDHWRRRLADLPALDLPYDRIGAGPATDRGALHSFSVAREVAEALDALRRREGATTFMVLLTALQTLLARCAEQDDIVVGTVAAYRNRLELEGAIGFFVNHLLLRTDLGGDPTFREALRRARAVCLDAYAHQDLPYDRLVADLRPDRHAAQPPLFQVLFVHGNPDRAALALPGIEASAVTSGAVTAKYDLTLFTHEGEHLGGVWRYRTDRFSAERMAWLSARFEQLLASVAADPDARLSRLDILGAAERERREREKLDRRRSRADRLMAVSRRAKGVSAEAP